jgi:hypothetical protein
VQIKAAACKTVAMKAMFRCAVAAALVAASAALWAAEAPSFKPIAPPDPNPLRYDLMN